MSGGQSPGQTQPFEIGDLVRLNEELKQLRETLKRKRADREQAKRQGKRLQVDLSPEIQRLSHFLAEIDRVSVKLKETRLPLPTAKMVEANPLDDVLQKVKAEIENEKKKLEAERTAREEENLKHQQELQRLRDEVRENKELLKSDEKLLGEVVTKTIEQSQKLQPEPSEADQVKTSPDGLQVAFSTAGVIAERPPITTRIEPTEIKQEEPEIKIKPKQEEPPEEKKSTEQPEMKIVPVMPTIEIQRELEEQARQNEALRRDIQARVTGEFTAIRSEIQRLREQISREQEALDTKRRDIDLERNKLEEERRTLQARISDTFTATKSELDRLREQISRKQEELDGKQKELYEERVRVDEEKRLLKERAGEVENERLRFMTRKMMDELQTERSELTTLKRSLQQLRSESARDRKRLERDRDSILRARVTLENEKRKTAWKNALLEIKARQRQALITQRQPKRPDRAEKIEKQVKEEAAKKQENIPNQAATTPPAPIAEGAVVLGVRLGEENYGIDIGSVREIMKRQTITPLPRQPSYVEGVMNVRGAIIPVVNLRKRFELKGEPSHDPHTVIVNSSAGTVGILVDSVSEVIRLPQDRIHPAPPIASGLDGEYIRGICRVGEQLLLYLDVEKVMRKATPISMLQGVELKAPGRFSASLLAGDERLLLKAIPITGIMKSRLKKRTKLGDARFDKAISSLKRKGLVKIYRDRSRRVISLNIPATSNPRQ